VTRLNSKRRVEKSASLGETVAELGGESSLV